MERELGASPSACPTCGTELEAQAQEDGSVAVEACPKCYGNAPEPQEFPEPDQEPEKPKRKTTRKSDSNEES